jgi:hypothetical protein
MLLLRGGGLGRQDATFVIRVLSCRGTVGMLKRTDRVLLIAGDRDDATGSWHLEDVVAMVGCRHALGEVRVPQDGFVREADVGKVEVDELGVVVVMLAEGDRRRTCPRGMVESSVTPENGLVGMSRS